MKQYKVIVGPKGQTVETYSVSVTQLQLSSIAKTFGERTKL